MEKENAEEEREKEQENEEQKNRKEGCHYWELMLLINILQRIKRNDDEEKQKNGKLKKFTE